MNTSRAKIIADAFSQVSSFCVDRKADGVCVSYLGNKAYFIREACFWPFIFNVARASHEEIPVAEIEAKLTA
ncbi:MAG: hypothetical protein ACE5F3_06620 [Mariprofundaceae bacterium]